MTVTLCRSLCGGGDAGLSEGGATAWPTAPPLAPNFPFIRFCMLGRVLGVGYWSVQEGASTLCLTPLTGSPWDCPSSCLDPNKWRQQCQHPPCPSSQGSRPGQEEVHLKSSLPLLSLRFQRAAGRPAHPRLLARHHRQARQPLPAGLPGR